jgi:hypothetical protein
MNITVIGRGNVGGGLARLWQAAGHDVSTLGRDGGDATDADVIVVAVPGDSIDDALSLVKGIAGKPVIDATNVYGPRDDQYRSNAHQIKAIVGGPVAKTFNLNYASEYALVASQSTPPGNLLAADADARAIAEQLNRDAGFEPIHVGNLDQARMLEDGAALMMAIGANGLGPFFYRFTPTRSH